ncbi:hypothetical protein E3J49_01995 [Candidatus Bathyarchaeota archaeon]|nr:hypothetical protein [Candidatus Bathyarchaeota archaeon]TET65329.1 MAG: hypothetical protein E3J49_01995 [Candidatus Bathyarchaeota archaeon]
MGRLLKNETLNYWVCGIVFSIIFAIIGAITTFAMNAVELVVGAILGFILYIIVMPYITGRLVDFVSDRWMD